MTRRAFRKGDVLVEQGSVLKCLMILRSGVALVTRRDDNGSGEKAELDPRDFFGEGGLLTGARQPESIIALTVVVYAITREGLGALMRDRPAISDELGSLLLKRTAAEQFKFHQLHGAAVAKSAPGLTARIRHLFNLWSGRSAGSPSSRSLSHSHPAN